MSQGVADLEGEQQPAAASGSGGDCTFKARGLPAPPDTDSGPGWGTGEEGHPASTLPLPQ